jgi:hypothetical protein
MQVHYLTGTLDYLPEGKKSVYGYKALQQELSLKENEAKEVKTFLDQKQQNSIEDTRILSQLCYCSQKEYPSPILTFLEPVV